MITPLYLSSTITNAAAPFTVGHPFKKGQVPTGSTVIADIADFQCYPTNYWEDGSLKFAILSGKVALTANVEKTIALDAGSNPGGTALTLADLKATNVTAGIALTAAKDWTFGTASHTVGSRLKMSNLLDVFDAASSTITADNGATVGAVTAAQDAGTLNVVLTAPLSGGTVGALQVVKYRAKYKVKRNISAITQGAVTRITVTDGWKTSESSTTDGLGVKIAAVGNTITFAGVGGMVELNGLTGTITAVGGSPYSWVEVNIDSTAFTAFTSGGTATKNELNTSDFDDIAYVRTGGGLEWNGTKTTYSAVNDIGATGVTWATTDWDAPFAQLVSGPKMSSWKYRKALAPDPHMVGWLEVRLYAGGNVQILPYVENGMLKTAGPTAKQATFAFSVNSVEKFNQSIELKAHTRTVLINGTHLSYWNVTDPDVVPRHDRDYIYSTHLVPTYRSATPDTASTITALPTTFAPFQRGNHQAAMGSAGFQADIGIIPNHDALYFTNGSRKTYEGMVRNGFSTGRYRIHYRDESNNWHRPLKFSGYPNLVMNGADAGMSSIGISTTLEYTPRATGSTVSGRTFSSSHHPSMGYVPYMVTAWSYFLEEMQFLSTLLFLKQVNSSSGRDYSKGLLRPEVGANQTRGAAWALRSLAQAAVLTPDSDALATELRTSAAENVLHFHAKYVAQPNNPFGFTHLYTDYTKDGSGDPVLASAFQTDFMTQAIGFMKSVDPMFAPDIRTKMDEFFAWKAKSAIGRLGGPGALEYLYCDAGEYSIPLGPNPLEPINGKPGTDFETGTGPWWSSWGEIWERLPPIDAGETERIRVDGPLRNGSFPTAGSYFANLLPAISYAVEHAVPGALDAYNRLVGASNWSSQEAAFVNYPVYGIAPASMTAVEEPPAVTTPLGAKVRIAKTGLVPGKVIMGISGFGVLAETIPEIGTHGPGLNYAGLSFPADTGKEILLELVSPPSGVLVVDKDYGATYDGGTSNVTYKVHADGAYIGMGSTSFTMIASGALPPTGVVTSQPAPVAQSQRFVGSTANATSGMYTMTAVSGGATVGPLAFTIANDGFDFTVSDLVAGTYSPSLTVTGPGGTANVTGAANFVITGNVVPDPDPDPVPTDAVPVMVGAIRIDSTTSSTIAFSWADATDDLGVVSYQYSINNGEWISTGTARSAVVGDLQPATGYAVAARAVDTSGQFSLPLFLTIATLAEPPPPLPDPTPAPTAASRNYAWLKLAIERWSHRKDLGTMMDDFIMLAEKRISADLEARLQVAAITLNTTKALNAVLVPPDVTEIRALSIPGIGSLDYIDPDGFQKKSANMLSGAPKFFTTLGPYVYLYPVPDSAYAMACAYRQRIPSLLDEVDGVNWLIRDQPDIYLAAVMCEVILYTKNFAEQATWETKYQDAVESLNRIDWHTGASLYIRSDNRIV